MIDEVLIDNLTEEEWTDSAENEPTQEQFNEWMRQRVEAELEEWPDDDIYRGEGDLEC